MLSEKGLKRKINKTITGKNKYAGIRRRNPGSSRRETTLVSRQRKTITRPTLWALPRTKLLLWAHHQLTTIRPRGVGFSIDGRVENSREFPRIKCRGGISLDLHKRIRERSSRAAFHTRRHTLIFLEEKNK